MMDSAAIGRNRGRVAVLAFAFALVLQSLAPPGYMAGSLEDGWPVVLCPEGLPVGFLGLSHSHHHHHHGEGHGHDNAGKDARPDLGLDGHCPLGGMLDVSAVATAGGLPLAHVAMAGAGPLRYEAPVLQRLPTLRVPRGPPIPA